MPATGRPASSRSTSTAKVLYVVSPPQKPVPTSSRTTRRRRRRDRGGRGPRAALPQHQGAHEVHDQGGQREVRRPGQPRLRRDPQRGARGAAEHHPGDERRLPVRLGRGAHSRRPKRDRWWPPETEIKSRSRMPITGGTCPRTSPVPLWRTLVTRRLADLRIAHKLYAGFAVVCLLLLVVAGNRRHPPERRPG